MRRILAGCVCGLFLLTVCAVTGCQGDTKAKTPASMMETPKQGPVAAGSGGGGGGGAGDRPTGAKPGSTNASD